MNDTTSNSGSIPGASPSGAASAGSPASGTPSPGTSPGTGTPSVGSEAPDTGGSLDFESMFSGPSGGGDPGVTDLGLEPSSPPSAAPAAPPAAPPELSRVPPQAAQAPAQAPPPQPQGTAPRQAPPGGDVPQGLDRYDPAQLASALAANEPQLTEVLATQVMALSPQEIEALETNIVEAIPRLMARTLLQAQKSALSQMAALMPVAIQRHTEVMRKAHTAEGDFYKAWPQLSQAQYRPLVWSYASVFRRMYPQATLQDIVAHVGPMVMAAARVPQGQPPPQGGRPATNGRRPPPSPFVPAGGMGPVPGAPSRELAPWEAMFAQQD